MPNKTSKRILKTCGTNREMAKLASLLHPACRLPRPVEGSELHLQNRAEQKLSVRTLNAAKVLRHLVGRH